MTSKTTKTVEEAIQDETWTDRRELRVEATPEQMYRAWADPEIIAGWFPDRAWGEATPGGEIVHAFEAFGMEMRHQVLEAEPPTRLVLKGEAPTGGAFRQEIHVRQEGATTVLELVHSGFGNADSESDSDWDDEYEGVDSGWKLALAILRHYLETHFGRPKKTLFVARPADFSWDHLTALFRTEDGLSSWLTESGAVGDIGSDVQLALRGAGPLTGDVLADSGREVALAWPEIDGVLELKAFGGGPWLKTLALRVSSWADDREGILQCLQPALEASLDRLVLLSS